MKFGAKIVLGGAILIGSLLTLAMPYAAQISYTVLALCRFFTGVAHVIQVLLPFKQTICFINSYLKGSFWPSMSSLWVTFSNFSNWLLASFLMLLNSLNGHLQLSEVD